LPACQVTSTSIFSAAKKNPAAETPRRPGWTEHHHALFPEGKERGYFNLKENIHGTPRENVKGGVHR
jgi:hypothetical protein